MPTDPKLETYLAALDKALGPVPVSDRADIITEIKSHILEARERDPNKSLSSILASLGEPESVANRYLLERGLKPGPTPKSPIVKWLTVGFLGTLGIFSLTLIVLIWKFTPIISVDEENERVVLLGGVIDVDGSSGKVKVGSTYVHHDKEAQKFDGAKPIPSKDYDRISIPFLNGRMKFESSLSSEMRWKCRHKGDHGEISVTDKNRVFILHLDKTKGAQCDIEIPEGVLVEARGTNGQVQILEPSFPADVTLTNGQVKIRPDSKRAYRYDFKITNGHAETPESSTDSAATPIKVRLTNGSIKVDD